mgnify:CR=1 FL=1
MTLRKLHVVSPLKPHFYMSKGEWYVEYVPVWCSAIPAAYVSTALRLNDKAMYYLLINLEAKYIKEAQK